MLSRTQTIADLGCGSGTVLSMLAPQVDWVIGVDREPAMLEAAYTKTSAFENVEIRQGELESPPLQEQELDLALLNLVLHLVEYPNQCLKSCYACLKAQWTFGYDRHGCSSKGRIPTKYGTRITRLCL